MLIHHAPRLTRIASAAWILGLVSCSLLTPSVDDLSGGGPLESGTEAGLKDGPADAASKDSASDIATESADRILTDAVIEPSPDGACPTGMKNCNGCVAVQAPAYGCGTTTCSACPSRANAHLTCQENQCVFTCKASWGDCNNDEQDGCETNLSTNQAHCGNCTTACAEGSQACVEGVCTITNCPSGTGDCDKNAANGCEVDLKSSVEHCGACAQPCALPNAQQSCVAGSCHIVSCTAPYQDCDGVVATGCEADLSKDPDHCGTCSVACSTPPKGSAACVNSACGVTCNTGFGNCNGALNDGCETSTETDPQHCGSCSHACAAPHSSPTCQKSKCGFVCSTGWADCNSVATDGCEVDVTSDLAHCGSCTTPCAPAHATGACVQSQCTIVNCASGWVDCDTSASTGCEADLQTDPSNCNVCGNVCPAPANATGNCLAGVCSGHHCNTGYFDCDGNTGNGCEINLQQDPSNCGTCGHSCAGTQCVAGRCETVMLVSGAVGKFIAVDDTSVFFFDSDSLNRVSKTGGSVTTMATLTAGMSGKSVGLDATYVYWIEGDTFDFKVMRIAKSGGGTPQTATTGSNFYMDLAQPLLVDNTNLYYAVYTMTDDCVIERISKNGGTTTCALQHNSTGQDLLGLALDSTLLFYAFDSKLQKRPKAGGSSTVLKSNFAPNNIAVDTQDLYVSQGSELFTIPIAGGTLTSLLNAGSAVRRLTIDTNSIYFTTTAAVQSAPKTGGTATTLADNQTNPYGIAVDDSFVYWVSDKGVARVAK